MHQHPGLVDVIVGVARDMRPPVGHHHPLPGRRQPLSQHGAGEARADDQRIVVWSATGGQHHRRGRSCRGPAARGGHDHGVDPLEGRVPAHLRQQGVSLAQPIAALAEQRQRRVALAHKGVGRFGDPNALQLTIGANHVDDRRGHHRPSPGQILRRLGRADEAGMFIDRERRDGHVPTAQVGRQLVIGPADTVVADAWLRQIALIGRLRHPSARLSKVRPVHA